MEKKNIYQRLSAITFELQTVGKNLEVKLPMGGYKAVGEVDIINAVKPLEEKHGVYSFPVKRSIVESKEVVNKKGNVFQFVRVETTYRAINIDNPEEFADTTSYGDGVDTQDKAPGKAMTYADKYALMKLYKISTGEDPDQHPSQDVVKRITPQENQDAIDKMEAWLEMKLDDAKDRTTVLSSTLLEFGIDDMKQLDFNEVDKADFFKKLTKGIEKLDKQKEQAIIEPKKQEDEF